LLGRRDEPAVPKSREPAAVVVDSYRNHYSIMPAFRAARKFFAGIPGGGRCIKGGARHRPGSAEVTADFRRARPRQSPHIHRTGDLRGGAETDLRPLLAVPLP